MTSLVTERSPEPGIWQAIYSNVWWILTKLPLGEGSCPWLQLRHSINLHKAMSLPFCLLCMYLSDNWSYPACIYTAAHGSYGQVSRRKYLLTVWMFQYHLAAKGISVQRLQLGDLMYSWISALSLFRNGVCLLGQHGTGGVR